MRKENIMNITKKLWLGIGILALLSPLGNYHSEMVRRRGRMGRVGAR